jgi:hypothetical protein
MPRRECESFVARTPLLNIATDDAHLPVAESENVCDWMASQRRKFFASFLREKPLRKKHLYGKFPDTFRRGALGIMEFPILFCDTHSC